MQLGMGLFAWSSGASRQLLEVLNHCCISVSYTTILNALETLGEEARRQAQSAFEEYPCCLTYDNVNMSHSIHVEQHADAPQKVESGTFPVIYQLHNARFEDMLLQPMLDNLAKASDLTMSDLKPTLEQMQSYHSQALIHIV